MRIFLIGLPGAGKSHWGRIWANELRLDFIDLDHEIEKQHGKSIPAIFSEDGESVFRQWEHDFLTDIIERDNYVLACGGGTPCFGKNMDLMNQHGITIFLNPELKTILKHLETDNVSRPLTDGLSGLALEKKINQLYLERKKWYAQSKFTLLQSELNPGIIKNKLMIS